MIARITLQQLVFEPWPIDVGFVADKMALALVLSLNTQVFSPSSMIPASNVLAVAHNSSFLWGA